MIDKSTLTRRGVQFANAVEEGLSVHALLPESPAKAALIAAGKRVLATIAVDRKYRLSSLPSLPDVDHASIAWERLSAIYRSKPAPIPLQRNHDKANQRSSGDPQPKEPTFRVPLHQGLLGRAASRGKP